MLADALISPFADFAFMRRALVACLSTVLSELESRVLSLYLDGHSYTAIGERLGCDCKTVDNALQRVKRKVGHHLMERNAA